MSENLGWLDFHCCIVEVDLDKVCSDTCFIDFLEEVVCHAKVEVADAFDGESDLVLARIEFSILACDIILELQQIVAVVKLKYVLGLSGVNKFHNCLLFMHELDLLSYI